MYVCRGEREGEEQERGGVGHGQQAVAWLTAKASLAHDPRRYRPTARRLKVVVGHPKEEGGVVRSGGGFLWLTVKMKEVEKVKGNGCGSGSRWMVLRGGGGSDGDESGGGVGVMMKKMEEVKLVDVGGCEGGRRWR